MLVRTLAQSNPTTPPLVQLPPSEIGFSVNENVWNDLNISIKTVEAHRANIMEKLSVNTVADLLRLALSESNT